MTDSARGRPTTYDPEICNELCNRIMAGRSVRSICDDSDMPAKSTVNGWLAEHQDFSHQYALALEFRTHLKAEQRHELLDEAMVELYSLPEGVNANVWANLIKERIRAIEWDAERLAAKRYKVQKEPKKAAGEELASALAALIDRQPS